MANPTINRDALTPAERQALGTRLETLEREFRSLAENLPLNVARWDADGRHLYINPAHERMLGRSAGEVVGTVVPDTHNHIKVAIAQVVATGQPVFLVEQPVPGGDGSMHLHDVNLVPERDSEGRIVSVLGVGRDMTDYYQTRKTIAAQEQEFRNLAENSPDFIIRYDRDGRIRYLNNALARELELVSTDGVIGKRPCEMWPDGRFANIERAAARAVESDAEIIFEIRRPGSVDQPQYREIRVIPERDVAGKIIGTIAFGRDITERKRTERDLRILTTAMNRLSDTVLLMDEQYHFVYANDAACSSLGYTREEFATLTPVDIDPDLDFDALKSMWDTFTDGSERPSFERRHRARDGRTYPVEISFTRIEFDGAEYGLAMSRDITERRRIEDALKLRTQEYFALGKDLEHIAYHDVLTGLPNRILLADRLRQSITRAHRAGEILAVAFLDLDNFKPINDMYGHQVGDRVLKEIAGRISVELRASDTVARIGGDEFVVLLAGETSAHVSGNTIQRLLRAIGEPIAFDDFSFTLSASVGISLYPDDDNDPDILLRNADQTMYLAKRSGRNQFMFYSQELREKAKQHGPMVHELRKALEQGYITVHYQPIVDLATGRIWKAEALARWINAECDPVTPAEFIPLAENSGLIHAVGDRVFHLASQAAREWNRLCPPSKDHQELRRIAINRSPRQFFTSDGVDDWADFLRGAQVSGEMLCIEITEGLLLDDRPGVLKQLNQMQALGISLSLDDFGTGYSSLSYLKKFNIDYLKIDRSFVSGIAQDESDRAIVESIIAMARRLNIKLIAEGVETQAQAELLAAAGCDMAQGYFYARPMPEQEFLEFVLATESTPLRCPPWR